MPEKRLTLAALLDDVMHGRPTSVPVVAVIHYAKDAREAGLPWLRSLASVATANDQARAVACEVLAERGEEPPLNAVRTLLSSIHPWARFAAASASRGPWASVLVSELEPLLHDDAVLSDLDYIYRVSDQAARALARVRPGGSEAMRSWYTATRADLSNPNAKLRDLATYVLAQLGDPSALGQLERLAAPQEEHQAQTLLEGIRREGTALRRSGFA